MSDGRGLRLNTTDIRFGEKYDQQAMQQFMNYVNEIARLNQKFVQMLRAGDAGQVLTKIDAEDLLATWETTTGGPPGPPGPPGAAGVDGINGTDGAAGAPGVVQAIVGGYRITIDSTDPTNPIVSWTRGTYLATTVAAGSVDDFAPASFGPLTRIVDIDPSAGNTDLTGFIAGEDMQECTFCNVNAANTLQIMKLNAGSAAANRWRLSDDLTMLPNQAITAIYSEDVDLWIVQS